ncbi:hypothetical protein LMG10661_01461 [Ralstonia syzygii subsp. syzygii]|nr:hypothetical protein LMG10661_01461 [Ralstonia syzygii subsp. syzygii]
MKRTLLAFVLGGAALCASTAALAHVDVGVSIGVPAPVYAPAPVVVGGGYYRDTYWREREWRRREWREHEWREREWHHRRGWDRD